MRKHIIYYISLFVLLFLGFYSTIYFSGQKQIQMSLSVLTASIYVVWGLFHHAMHHSFSIRIVLEYLAIGVLGISIIFFVLQIGL